MREALGRRSVQAFYRLGADQIVAAGRQCRRNHQGVQHEARRKRTADATHHSLRMRAITLGANPSFTLPSLDFAAVAAGIDARKVVDCGILPVINSGIAHREPGIGQIGAGVTTAPMACFGAAVKALADCVRSMSHRL